MSIMERYTATVNNPVNEGDFSLVERVTRSFTERSPLAVIAVRETIEIPYLLQIERVSRLWDYENHNQAILEFSGVTISPEARAFIARSPDPGDKPFDLFLDQRVAEAVRTQA